jgi:hypothetical protein
MPEGAPVIDCWLAAFRAPMSLQLRSTILAMRNGLALRFAAAEKSPSARLRLFECGDRRIAQDKFFQVIGHTSARLQKPFCGVYALIQALVSKRLQNVTSWARCVLSCLIGKFALTGQSR